jgi:hypothetical protein
MTTTAILILTVFIVVGIYDAAVVFKRGVGSSVSRCLQRLGFRSPIAMLVIGTIIGHLWFEMEPECPVVEAPKGCKMIFVDERTSVECRPLEKFEELQKLQQLKK